jgi:four helix bundle protein
MKNDQRRKFDLEERVILFAVKVIKMSEILPRTLAGIHLARQLIRSGTSPALNYGEAQSGESRKDFIHKMKIALKELRETRMCMKIIYQAGLIRLKNEVNESLKENNELISIFVKSIQTAQNNLNIEQHDKHKQINKMI